MTKSAKQDTAKASAEPAGTGSAATGSAATGSAATESAATQEAVPGPDETVGPAAGAEAAEAGDPAKPDLDETKRKFREALERKHQAHIESQTRGGRDSGKISGAHGPAASRRNFRRKSG